MVSFSLRQRLLFRPSQDIRPVSFHLSQFASARSLRAFLSKRLRRCSLLAPMNTFQQTMDHVGTVVDAAGVAVIVVGILSATVRSLVQEPPDGLDRYAAYRQSLGRAILLGLEFLVAGDIIRTVAVAPTLQNMAVLGAIVVIRTFLSFSLELEISGRWPWQPKRQASE